MRHAILALVCSLLSGPAAAQLSVVYLDAPGTGFFSTEARTPVGGNTGTTLGEQRRILMDRALEIWNSHLEPQGPVVIEANFEALPCSAFGLVLAGAGPIDAFQNFPSAPQPDTFYVSALANHLSQSDLSPTENEIRVRINSGVDSDPACAFAGGFYYGLDGNAGDQTLLLRTLLHEIAHGLGFSALVDNTDGDFILGAPDVFTKNLLYLPTSESWAELDSAGRLAAAMAGPLTVWAGRGTQLGSASQVTGGQDLALITRDSDGTIFPAEPAVFGPGLPVGGITAEIVLVDDGIAPTADACQGPFVNAADIAGKIALIDRGACDFSDKTVRAQQAGAVAVLIANTTPLQIISMSGSSAGLTIPTLAVTFANGQTLRSLSLGETLTLRSGTQPGTHLGRPFLETPFAFAPGSSISHFDGTTAPGLLMRPDPQGFIPADPISLDLTLTVMRDMGWNVRNIPFPNLDYELWAQLNDIASDGPEDDSDGDKHSNLSEYAFGGDPDDPSSFPIPPLLSVTSGSQGLFDYSITNQSVDLSFRVLRLDTLPDPTPELVPAGMLLDGSGEIDLMRADLGGLGAFSRAFFRVEASLPSNEEE